jgi:hypothetical protein
MFRYFNDQTFHEVDTENLRVGRLKYPNQDGSSGDVIETDGNGNLSLSPVGSLPVFKQVLWAMVEVITPVTTDISVGDHIKFNVVMFENSPSLVSLDSTSPYTSVLNTNSLGRITSTVPVLFKAYPADVLLNSSTDFVTFRWINANTGSNLLSNYCNFQIGPSGPNYNITSNPAIGAAFPSGPTRYELQIIGMSSPLISYSRMILEAYINF